jgi:tryptophan 2,3-dioxygenase
MPPANFLKFRGRLQPASGFGSAQFREIEYLLGLRELHEKKLQPEGGEPSDTEPLWKPSGNTPSDQRAMSFYVAQTAWGRERVARRARETSLRDVVYGLLNAAFLAGSRPEGPEKGLPDMRPAAIDRLVAKCVNSTLDDHYRGASAGRLDAAGIKLLGGAVQSLNESLIHRETIAATLIEARPEKELFAAFLDVCLELDRSLLQWRDRHIRFVEGMIGTRRGTGGGGLRYLTGTVASTDSYLTQAFPCLWQARSFVQ